MHLTDWDRLPVAEALVVAVAHRAYLDRSVAELTAKLKPGGCFVDVKSKFDRKGLAAASVNVWGL